MDFPPCKWQRSDLSPIWPAATLHDRTVLMRISLAACAVLLFTCTTASTEAPRSALVRGDQAEVDSFTRAFLAGNAAIDRAALEDDRPVHRSVVLRIEEDRRISQYGVD